jgi:DNA-binding response OmpR family regulator
LKHILIVDDDHFVCELVSRVLEADYRLCVVSSGEAALEQLARQRFHLILLDIVMPPPDGWEVLRQIRANPRTTLLPVMFLTGRKQLEDRLLGFRMGVDDYLEKPFSGDELLLRVSRLLERAEALGRPDLGDQAGFQGSLTDFGLAPVLTLLAMENKTGHFYLNDGKSHIRIYFRQGQVVKASQNDEEGDGYEAITAALSLKTGTFQFAPMVVEEEDQFNQSTSQLLLEVAREMDEKRGEAIWQDPPEFKK